MSESAAHDNGLAAPAYVALADIDHFKTVNDTFGHVAGDAVLIEVASRMRASIRHYDTIGRYGGEEFLIVLPGIDRHRAYEMAERLRIQVAKDPYHVLEEEILVTLSIGVTVDSGKGSPRELLREADAALYRAKARGRNIVEMYHSDDSKVDTLPKRNSG